MNCTIAWGEFYDFLLNEPPMFNHTYINFMNTIFLKLNTEHSNNFSLRTINAISLGKNGASLTGLPITKYFIPSHQTALVRTQGLVIYTHTK